VATFYHANDETRRNSFNKDRWRFQNILTGHTVRAEGEGGTAKDKLGGHGKTPPEEHGHHKKSSRMASLYGPMHPTGCGIN